MPDLGEPAVDYLVRSTKWGGAELGRCALAIGNVVCRWVSHAWSFVAKTISWYLLESKLEAFVTAILITIPSTVAGIANLNTEKYDVAFIKNAQALLQQYPNALSWLYFFPLLLLLFKPLRKWGTNVIRRRRAEDTERMLLMMSRLLRGLDEIVEQRRREFSLFIERNHLSWPVHGQVADVFRQVAQPMENIQSIAKVLCGGLKALSRGAASSRAPEANFQVVIAKVTRQKVTFLACAPVSELGEAETRAQAAAAPEAKDYSFIRIARDRSKDIVIIEDIEAELRKKEHKRRISPYEIPPKYDGSALCYIIEDQSWHGFHICIRVLTSVKFYFRPAEKKLWRYALGFFANRVAMEYNLLMIQEGLAGITIEEEAG